MPNSSVIVAGPEPKRVLVFDSGVGGLSVVAALRSHAPHLSLTYLADSAFLPYGNKTEADLVQRVPDLLVSFLAQHPQDAVVIACNTASTIVLPRTRDMLEIPVIGTVPAIKPAGVASKTRVIGLLGTPGTVRRAYTQHLIDEFAQGCQVIRHGTTELVDLAEAKLRGVDSDEHALEAACAPLFAAPNGSQIDCVVLACTHFPLLLPELAQACPHVVTFIDSGAAIARRTLHVLGQSSETIGEAALASGEPAFATIRRGRDGQALVSDSILASGFARFGFAPPQSFPFT